MMIVSKILTCAIASVSMSPTHETTAPTPGDEERPSFAEFIDAQLKRKGWSIRQCAAETGLSESLIHRWRTNNYTPNIANARTFAHGVGVSVLDVLIASGQITPDEVCSSVKPPERGLDAWSSVELLQEVIRRLETATERVNLQSQPSDETDATRPSSDHLSGLAAALAQAGWSFNPKENESDSRSSRTSRG